MPRLLIFDECVRAVDLPEGRTFVIGRSRTTDVPVRDGVLSRRHCELSWTDEGFRLRDLGSAHGTWLNGRRISEAELLGDDVIEVGGTVIVFLDTAAWARGEAVSRLRNPEKAQELVRRIQKAPIETASRLCDLASGGGGASDSEESSREAAAIDLLSTLVVHEYAKRCLHAAPQLLHAVQSTVSGLLESPELASDPGALAAAARRELRARLRDLVSSDADGAEELPPAAGDSPGEAARAS